MIIMNKVEEAVTLPDDIIFNILLEMPANYILKLKCVCKAWYALISHSSFTNSFLRPFRNIDSPSLFILHRYDYTTEVHLSTFQLGFPNQSKTKLLLEKSTDSAEDFFLVLPSSVNGLVCIVGDFNFHICNPMTEQFRTFPIHKKLGSRLSHRQFGFGFDKSKNVYKLVQVYSEPYMVTRDKPPPYNSMQCAVLTISGTTTSSSCWKRITDPPELPLDRYTIFVDGFIYWLVNSSIGMEGVTILKFDIEDEKFSRLTVPTELENRRRNHISLVELQGRFCIVDKIFNKVTIQMDLWILQDCANNVWVRQHRIVFDYVRSIHRLYEDMLSLQRFYEDMLPRCIIRKGKVVLEDPVYGLVSYDTKNKLLERLYDEHKESTYYTTPYSKFDIFGYVTFYFHTEHIDVDKNILHQILLFIISTD